MTAPTFHRLRVAEVQAETEESVSVTFEVPVDLRESFGFLPGQHVTVRAMIDGEDVRRSYSICASANSGVLRVGIKRLNGGAFSTYATTRLAVGDTLDVMPPVGEFTIEPDSDAANHYCAVAAGSGITPILSLMSSTLEAEPLSRWTLVYGNRTAATIMFLDEVEGMKDRYPDRLHVIHVLSREETELPMLTGRIDAAMFSELLRTLVPRDVVDGWYLCGPFEMVQAVRSTLEDLGTPSSDIHDELFFAGPVDPSDLPPEPESEEGSVSLRVTLAGRVSTVRMSPDTAILDAALRARHELPFSCRGGMCASCKAKLVEGDVAMRKNFALVEEDLAAGFILTCQARPTSERVAVDYDVR